MAIQRTDRLNSLLKEVITEVIQRDVRNPHVHQAQPDRGAQGQGL